MPDIGFEALLDALISAGADAAVDVGVGAATEAGAGAVGDAVLSGGVDAALGSGIDATVSGALGGAGAVGDAIVGGGVGDAAGGVLGGALNAGGIGDALGGSLAGVTASPEVTNIGPLITQPASLGGAQAVGSSPVGGAFDVASGLTTSGAPGAPGAVAPAGGVGGVGSDLTSKAVGAGGTAAPVGGKSFLDTAVEGASKNALPAAIAGAGLGYNILSGNKKSAPATALGATAEPAKAFGAQTAAEGKNLTGYLEAGTLPANMQTSLDNAVSAAKTKAISNAASQGLPTDPTKNTALAQSLQKIDQDAITTKAQLGQQLMTSGQGLIKTGLDAAGMSNDIYKQLIALDQSEQKQISEAIANFSKALGGMGGSKNTGGLNIKVT